MDVSVIIPAHNEQAFLNKTIDSFLSNAAGFVECIVVLNGYEQDVDPRARVIHNKENLGERIAMNQAVKAALGKYIIRIDAHCDIDKGWDTKLIEAFKDKPHAVVVPVITCLDKNWKRHLGHWYGFCKLLPTFEEKWHTKKEYGIVEPNMGLTGCGMMMNREWYLAIGGADENMPRMGAIGPEFATYAHLHGDGVFTRTDVLLGHVFDTGGYDTSGVAKARETLSKKYGTEYFKIASKFRDWEGVSRKRITDKTVRTVTINRRDVTVEKNDQKQTTKRIIRTYQYIYKDNGEGPSEEELQDKYGPLAKDLVSEEVWVLNDKGQLVKETPCILTL